MKQLKTLIVFAISALFFFTAQAQAPQKMNYQTVVRDAAGNELSNTAINIQFIIHDSVPAGPTAFSETQYGLTTNQLGLLNTQIGRNSGNLAAVNWGKGEKYLQVKVDINNNGTFIDMGTTQLISVAYALYAANSPPGATGPTGPIGAQGIVGPTGPIGSGGGATGATGATGADGVGIAGITYANGALSITLTNGIINSFPITGIVGPTGPPGIPGPTGPTGNTGPKGEGMDSVVHEFTPAEMQQLALGNGIDLLPALPDSGKYFIIGAFVKIEGGQIPFLPFYAPAYGWKLGAGPDAQNNYTFYSGEFADGNAPEKHIDLTQNSNTGACTDPGQAMRFWISYFNPGNFTGKIKVKVYYRASAKM